MKREELVALLNSQAEDRETGSNIINGLSSMFNCFTSYKRLAKSLYDELNKNGKNRLVTIWALCGLYFAWHYRRAGYERWDLRDRHSFELAYKNCELLENIMKEYSGIKIKISDLSDSEISEHHFEQLMWKTGGVGHESYLSGAASEWCGEHPTLRQSFWGGFYEGVIEDLLNENFVPNSEYGIAFPFI